MKGLSRSLLISVALGIGGFLGPALPALADTAAPPAIELVDRAKLKAQARGNKALFVGFHASWCVWCRTLEKLTTLPETKPVFDRYFEIVWLTVDERTSLKDRENPGASELRDSLGAKGLPLPVYAVVDSKGMVVARSLRIGLDGRIESIGFPGTPDEIAFFIDLIRTGAPSLTEAEEKLLRDAIVSLLKR